MVESPALMLVADADLDFRQPVEHVELGQRQPVDAADLHRLPYQDGIEPAAAARPARHHADLPAAPAEKPPVEIGWTSSREQRGCGRSPAVGAVCIKKKYE